MRTVRCVVPAWPFLAVFAAFSVGAQTPTAHPDFSGVWIMDTAKSPGPMIPQAMTYVIEHRGDTLRVKRHT